MVHCQINSWTKLKFWIECVCQKGNTWLKQLSSSCEHDAVESDSSTVENDNSKNVDKMEKSDESCEMMM